MTTRIETMPGDYAPPGALTLQDLPFNRANLESWISARDVATHDDDGETLIDGFNDLQTGELRASGTGIGEPPLRLIRGFGVPYGENRYEITDEVVGYSMGNPRATPAQSQTIFAIVRPDLQTPVSFPIYNAYTSSSTQPALRLRQSNVVSEATIYQITARRIPGGTPYILYARAPRDSWFAIIVECNYIENTAVAEVLDFSVQSIPAFSDGSGEIGSEGDVKSLAGLHSGGLMEVGRFAGPFESTRNKKSLRAYLRRTVAMLNAAGVPV